MPNAGDDDHKVQFALQAESCDANSSSVDDTILRDKCWWSMMACLNISLRTHFEYSQDVLRNRGRISGGGSVPAPKASHEA
ncbi:hypothetical protein HN51_063130 [Arachis hypogaea]